MPRRLLALALAPCLLGPLVACAPLTEENAPLRLAETVCRKERACQTDRWDDQWDRDFEDCVGDNEDAFELALDVGGIFGLEVDLEEVANCRSDINRSSCDDYIAADIGPNCEDMLAF